MREDSLFAARSFPRFPALLILCGVIMAGSCAQIAKYPAPSRDETPAEMPTSISTISAPVEVPLSDVARELERTTPRLLWSIDERRPNCVPPTKVGAFGASVNLKPKIGCRITGKVTRGPIALTGRGRDMLISFPVRAKLGAHDIGGIIKGETATGSANVTVKARLAVTDDWRPRASVSIDYDWRGNPGIDFLGQRISLQERADRELKPVVRQLEKSLQGEVAKIDLRRPLEGVWKSGFRSFQANGENPEVWITMEPKSLRLAGYDINRSRVRVDAVMTAATTAILGTRPAAQEATALPLQTRQTEGGGLKISLPVLASYEALEPILLDELRKLAARPITLPGAGPVDAQIHKVTVYATDGGRLAVGIDASVKPLKKSVFKETTGLVWLVGIPENDADTQLITVRNLSVYGNTDRATTDLLVLFASSDFVRLKLESALKQDFSGDFDKLLVKVQKAVEKVEVGNWALSARINDVEHGQIAVTGDGLLLPVELRGTGAIAFKPE